MIGADFLRLPVMRCVCPDKAMFFCTVTVNVERALSTSAGRSLQAEENGQVSVRMQGEEAVSCVI